MKAGTRIEALFSSGFRLSIKGFLIFTKFFYWHSWKQELGCCDTNKNTVKSFQDLYTGPEYEIAKFSFVVGKGKIQGKFRYEDPHTWMTSPALYLFRDERWEDYHKAPACDDKTQFAFKAIPIGVVTPSHINVLHRELDAPTKTNIEKGPDGLMEWTFSWEFDTEERTRGWFLIAADCALEQFNAKVPPMQFEISLFNPGETHLPADEFGLPKLYLLTAVVLVAFGVYGISMVRQTKKETGGKTHLVVWLLGAAYVTLLASLGCELAHLQVYKHNGYGVWLFDLFSDLFDGLSQLTVAFVLICLASGWTLVEYEDDSVRKNSVGSLLRHPENMVKGANRVVFAALSVVVITTTLQIVNKLDGEDFTKFHDYESFSGKVLVYVHLGLGIFFVFSLIVTLRAQAKLKSTQGGGDKLVIFLRRLLFFGGIWFLCFPFLVFIASFIAHYNRHRVVSGGVLLVQTACLLSLTHQFTSSHSQYHKLSTLADTGVLPGAGGFVKPQKLSKD